MLSAPNFFSLNMKRLSIIIGLICSMEVVAQNDYPCGTEMNAEQKEFMLNMNHSGARLSNVVVNIPVTIHIIRQSNGSGGLSEATLDFAMDNLNDYYQNSSMRFEVDNINYIDDDNFYDYDASQEGALGVPNDVSGTINIYFSNSITSGGGGLCGYTRFPPSTDRVFVANGCINGGTFEHEIGHYFTLWHTHGKTNTGTTDELVDGSNCTIAGDNICDTPADPNLSGLVTNCAYTGALTDANGEFFSPNVNNIMSYAPGGCRNDFTTGQYDRIRQGFESGRSYLDFSTEGFSVFFSSDETEVCVGSEIEFTASAFGATEYEWFFQGGTPELQTGSNVSVTYDSPGSFDVEVLARNGSGSEVTSKRKDYISVDDPLEFSTSDAIINELDDGDLPVEWKLENPDQAVTFSISSVDRNGDGSSGSIFMNHFEYSTDVSGNFDVLSLTTFEKEGIRGFNISFDYAYSYGPAYFDGEVLFQPRYDSIALVLDNNCLVEDKILWRSGGEELSTSAAVNSAFIPNTSEWSSFSMDHEITTEVDYSILKLVSLSYNGNNLYIDNINIIPDYSLEAPGSLQLSESNDEVTLEWRDNSINEVGFIIQRKVGSGDFVNLDTTASNVEEYVDMSPASDQVNFYRVLALGIKDNVSEPSSEVEFNTILGLESVEVLVYPNATNGHLNIFGLENGNVRIFAMSGSYIEAHSILNESVELDLTHLNSGLYILKLSSYDGRSIRRKILLR